MAKIIYTCVRDPSQAPAVAQAVAAVAARLVPDNLPQAPTTVLASNGIVTGIAGDAELLDIRGSSIAAGYLVEPGAWDQPGSGRPDGAYALFRSDETTVELVSDTLASRTVWYVLTDRLFIASTSQRAIVALLGSLEFNPAAVPWMLASGMLPPEQSWDHRIRFLKGATEVRLDRRSWTLSERSEPVRFAARDLPEAEHALRLTKALRRVVGAAHVSDPRWAIALSGGVDCRTILCLLEETRHLRAVTWGLRASLDDPANDACIARRLAQHFGLEHQYFETDLSAEPVERVFERFVANGEGRIDNISGYTDGFALWRQLHDSGVRGIVRGDEAFGMKRVHSTEHVRAHYLPRWSDYPDLPPLESLGLPPQSVPDRLLQQAGESLDTWRDRLQQQVRAQCMYAALSDLKLPYVEIINPLISGSLVELVRQLPDALRTDKALFTRVAHSLSPDIPFASNVAIQAADDVLKSPRAVELLQDTLKGPAAGHILPPRLAAFASGGLTRSAKAPRRRTGRSLRDTIRPWVPAWARQLRSAAARPPSLDRNRLALRAYLVAATHRLLTEDAACLRRAGISLDT